MKLITTFYKEKNVGRLGEFRECIERNLRNEHIEKIHIFYEKPGEEIESFLKHEKVEIHPIETRPTFRMFFDFANRHLGGQTVIVANTDIYFDNTLRFLRGYDFTGKVLALTKYNVAPSIKQFGKIWQRNTRSQDAWIFKSPMKELYSDIVLGYTGCDNRLVMELNKENIEVVNPSLTIKTWHVHKNSSVDSCGRPLRGGSYRDEIHGRDANGKFVFLPKQPEFTFLDKIKLYLFSNHAYNVNNSAKQAPALNGDYDIVDLLFDKKDRTEMMVCKADLIIKAIKENWGHIFAYSEIDKVPAESAKNIILTMMKYDMDMLVRRSGNTGDLFSGFFVIQGNEKNLRLWQEILKLVSSKKSFAAKMDLENLLSGENKYDIRWDCLPGDFCNRRFLNYAKSNIDHLRRGFDKINNLARSILFPLIKK